MDKNDVIEIQREIAHKLKSIETELKGFKNEYIDKIGQLSKFVDSIQKDVDDLYNRIGLLEELSKPAR